MNRSQYKKPSIKKTVKPAGPKKQLKSVPVADIYSKSKDAIEKYRVYLDVEKNYSEHTVNGYIKDIEDFSEYLKTEKFGARRVFLCNGACDPCHFDSSVAD